MQKSLSKTQVLKNPSEKKLLEKLIVTKNDKQNLVMEVRMVSWCLISGDKLERMVKRIINWKSKWIQLNIEKSVQRIQKYKAS